LTGPVSTEGDIEYDLMIKKLFSYIA